MKRKLQQFHVFRSFRFGPFQIAEIDRMKLDAAFDKSAPLRTDSSTRSQLKEVQHLKNTRSQIRIKNVQKVFSGWRFLEIRKRITKPVIDSSVVCPYFS